MPTTAEPGDIVLVRFPFSDLTTTKVRPAVVLAAHGDDVTIVGVFSSIPQPVRGTWLAISDRDPHFATTGLRAASVVKAERIAVIEQSLIVRKLGILPAAQFQRLKEAVKRCLQLD
jgi:mRNA interferase MazF